MFGSEEESIFDTLLLYLYQTIVLACLAAAGFIFYLFRTRAPLKEQPDEAESENAVLTNGQLAGSVSDDEILLRSALLHDHVLNDEEPEPDGYYPQEIDRQPIPVPPQPYPHPAPRRKHEHEEEEEEEEEDGPFPSKQPAIRQMVTTRQGVHEETITNYPSYQQPPRGYQEYQNSYPPPPQIIDRPGISDAMKIEAKKRIGHAIQKKQVQDWVGGGEFDEAITNIRAASQRLQSSGF